MRGGLPPRAPEDRGPARPRPKKHAPGSDHGNQDGTAAGARVTAAAALTAPLVTATAAVAATTAAAFLVAAPLPQFDAW